MNEFAEITDCLNAPECKILMQKTDELLKDYDLSTDYDRVRHPDANLAAIIYDRLQKYIDKSVHDELKDIWHQSFVHPKFFWTRYSTGGNIDKHRDGCRDDKTASTGKNECYIAFVTVHAL